MKGRIQTNPRVANDNGKSTKVVSLAARHEGAARQASLMRDWAPAILATFFTVDCGSMSGAPRMHGRGRTRRAESL